MFLKKFIYLIVVLVAIPLSATAQSVDTYLFEFSDTLETVGVEDALGRKSERRKYRLLLRASYDYNDGALIVVDSEGEKELFEVIDDRHSFTLGGSYLVSNRILLGGTVSYHLTKLTNDWLNFGLSNATEMDQNSLGDIDLHAKIRLTNVKSRWGFAVMPEIKIPTGSVAGLTTDEGFGFGLKLLVDAYFGRTKVYGNLGYHYADGAVVSNVDRSSRVEGALGVYFPFTRRETLALVAELHQSMTVSGLEKHQNPSNVTAALRAKLGGMRLFAGGGFGGFTSGDRSNKLAFFAGLKMPLLPLKRSFVKKKRKKRMKRKEIREEMAPEIESFPEPISEPFVEEPPKPSIKKLKKSLSVRRDIKFKTNSDEIKQESFAVLQSAFDQIKPYVDQINMLTIEGHTDSRGADAYNLSLSQRRAESVKKFLVERGLPKEKLNAKGFGETKPIANNNTENGRSQNRRVEFVVKDLVSGK